MDTAASSRSLFNEANVTILVADMDASVSFYTATLGFALKSRYGNEFALVQGPGITIGLHPAGRERAGKISIGLGVDSLEEAKRSLEVGGVGLGDIVEDPPMRFIFFQDPDGVELYLGEQSQWR